MRHPWALLLALSGCRCGAGPETPGTLVVQVPWEGASPAAVEEEVLAPVEGALRNLPGARQVVGIAREGRAEVRVTLSPGADPGAVPLMARDALAGVTLPPDAQRPSLTTAWHVDQVVEGVLVDEGQDPAAVAEERARELAGEGFTASVLSDGVLARTRLLDAEAVVARGVDPRALLERLADGEEIPELDAISSTRTATAGDWFYRDGAPLAVVRRDRSAPAHPDWTVLDTHTCVRAAGPEAEVVAGLLARGASWGTAEGEVLAWTDDLVSPGALGALPGVDALEYPCDQPPLRLGLVALTLDADLDVAVADLARWSGTRAVLPLYRSGPPEVVVRLDQERAVALGLDVSQVALAMRGVEQPDGTRVRWAEPDDAEAIGRLPLVTADGVVVPLQAVASLEQGLGSTAIAHVDGRRARLVDLTLLEGVTLADWTPPPDVEVIEL